jgi:hypothetical protein
MTCGTPAPVIRVFRRTALPLICYYAVTLGLPLANGAGRSGAIFVEHAVFVLCVPVIAIVAASLVCTTSGLLRRKIMALCALISPS